MAGNFRQAGADADGRGAQHLTLNTDAVDAVGHAALYAMFGVSPVVGLADAGNFAGAGNSDQDRGDARGDRSRATRRATPTTSTSC